MITAPALEELSGIKHGFFTRKNGLSTGLYKSLNVGLGSDDERETVLKNRALVAQRMGVSSENLVTAYQVHSSRVLSVKAPLSDEQDRKADALVTNTPELAIGVLTADCGPVLFADPKNRVIGATHAGWKGAFSGILQNTVEAMEALGAERGAIIAVIGPLISQRNYEVGPEFHGTFIEADESHHSFFSPSSKGGHFLFNLPEFIGMQLKQTKIASIIDINCCTYAQEQQFFSYRRATHRSEPDYGRQISAISLSA
ncbi:peptidoglycan editing factor PgeF [Flexibacterium corallicola]|uniref:peptidoglycan editing factor PgeF n=1 Tax=Flexibacterium corallicola TaxID=3037259 RepID=UPI00286F695D|nr:peptidoglycan editing factor PgeF [Pseudovibrio sp. M1P-2-3]